MFVNLMNNPKENQKTAAFWFHNEDILLLGVQNTCLRRDNL